MSRLGSSSPRPLEYRIGSRGQVRVDPLEVEHDVESELADLDALGPAGSCPSKMFVGGTQFELPKNFLFP